jgi:hypothetical protein
MMDHETIRAIEDAFKRVLFAHNETPWRDSEGAAAYLGVEPGTVKFWRAKGGGPRYRAVGTKLVRYHTDDLDAFLLGEDGR